MSPLSTNYQVMFGSLECNAQISMKILASVRITLPAQDSYNFTRIVPLVMKELRSKNLRRLPGFYLK